MQPYVDAAQQLVVEIFVRDIAVSRAFYERLGFTTIEDKGSFVSLTWEGHRLFLDQRDDLPPPAAHPRANVRVMVADVDRVWQAAQAMGATVFAPIRDQEYGLRDFTILDPDGFGVRFGTFRAQRPPPTSAAK